MSLLTLLVGLSAATAAPLPEEKPLVRAVLRAKMPKQKRPRDMRNFLLTHQKGFRADKRAMRKALARPEVAALAVVRAQDDPVKWLQDNLVVEIRPEEGTLRVGVRDGPGGEQVVVVNAYVDAYLDNFSRNDIALRKSLASLERSRTILKRQRAFWQDQMRRGAPDPRLKERIGKLDLSIKEEEEETARMRRRLELQPRLVVVRKASGPG